MKTFRSVARAVRPDFPTYVCSAIDQDCGHVCGLEASWQAAFDQAGIFVRTYCRHHAPPEATPIPAGARFQVARLEVRVAVPLPLGDPHWAADRAVRRVVDALEDVGGLIVGVHVVGEKAAQDGLDGPPLRLELAGRPTPYIPADEPFWGVLRAPWRRRRDAERKIS